VAARRKKSAPRKPAARGSGASRKRGGGSGRSGGSRPRARAKTVADSRRELEASEKIYYRIGEVAELTDVKPYVLRYWESEFKWMAPSKSRSNQRLYRKPDIETILLIKKLLYDERFTIAGAKKRLKELGSGAERAAALAAPPPMDPDDWVGNLREIREELEAIRAAL
jgi:DNA-binding transcriptional MerR regulator